MTAGVRGGKTKRIVLALALAGLVGGSASFPATAQQDRSGAEAAYKPPRGPDGKPDLSGVWQVPAKEVLALGAVGAVPARPGVVEGGAIPYKPEALAKRNENREKWLERDPEIRCYLPGVPRANYMQRPFQIFQSDKSMLFAYEYAGAVRNILFEDPGPAPVDSWMGQSVGRTTLIRSERGATVFPRN
ncbi:MAG: hypothetical protein PHG43_13615 [Phenylobacterium sp.]|nr:hypothetical protein [Phenylobacterium sp.]